MRKTYIVLMAFLLTLFGCMQVVSSNKNEAPEAKFSVTPKTGTTKTDFIFDGSFSSDDRADIQDLAFFWEYFSAYGRRIDSAYGMIDTATFADTGQFVISLSVFDPDSLMGWIEDTIQVNQYREPTISVIDTTINFGPVEIDYTIRKPVKVSNTGMDTLTISAVYFSGAGKASFSSDFEQEMNILPDSTAVISVYFSPHETGDYTTHININSNDPKQAIKRIEIVGEAYADLYDLELTNLPTDSLNFGNVMVDEKTSFDLTIKNTGNTPRQLLAVYITGAGKSGFDVDFTSDFTIPAGSERSLNISFSPEDTINYRATLVIKSDDTFSKTKEITLRGKGYQNLPLLELSNIADNTLNFEEVGVEKTAEFLLILANNGKADLNISAIYITGPDRDMFGTDFDEEFTLSPAEKKIITIQFTPANDISYSAILNIHSNDETRGLQEISLNGKGVLSKLNIVSPTNGKIAFGNVDLGRDSTIYIEIENSGKGELAILDAYITQENKPAFRCDFDDELVLNSGENNLIGVTFSPLEIFDYNAELVIKTDELVDNKKVLPITGSGYQELTLYVDRDSLLFGDVLVETDTTAAITLENTGNKAIKIPYAYFTGPDVDYFSSDFEGEKIIAAGTQAVINITFSPVDARPLDNNYFCFFSDAPEQPLQKIFIDGQGVFPPEISCPDTLDFDEVSLNQNKTLVLTMENTGKSQIINLELSIDSEEFSFDIVQPIDLLPGISLDADIIFNPTIGTGPKNAILTISSENWGVIKNVWLRGTAK